MSGGGEGIGIRDGVGGVGEGVRQVSGGGGVEFRGGCPGHPRVKMKTDIVSRENKILTRGLNEKNPTIM